MYFSSIFCHVDGSIKRCESLCEKLVRLFRMRCSHRCEQALTVSLWRKEFQIEAVAHECFYIDKYTRNPELFSSLLIQLHNTQLFSNAVFPLEKKAFLLRLLRSNIVGRNHQRLVNLYFTAAKLICLNNHLYLYIAHKCRTFTKTEFVNESVSRLKREYLHQTFNIATTISE